MANYGRCKECRYCNSSECKGYKLYCEWYGTYEDPDEIKDCNHYRP